MNSTDQPTRLNDAIRNFEAALEAPPPPASREEVRQWAERMHSSFKNLHALIELGRRKIHRNWFELIEGLDESESSRIAELKKADAEVEKLLDVVDSQLIVLALPAPEVDAHLEEQIEELIDRGHQLILWIRDQEDTVTGWYTEAFAEKVGRDV